MTDLKERLTGENLIEPLTFEQGEIDKFIQRHSCGLCGGHLFSKFAPDRKYTAHCPEHGAVMSHTHVSKYKAEQADQNIRAGKAELRQPKKPRSNEEIIKGLGF